MPVKQNYAGRTFGQITLDSPVENRPGYWKGRCSCGNSVEKRIDNLKRPGNHTCGKCTPPPSPLELDASRLATLEAEVAALREELAAWKAHGPPIPVPESSGFPG